MFFKTNGRPINQPQITPGENILSPSLPASKNPPVDMWITLRCATSYPHIHRHYYYAPAKRGHLYFAKKRTFLFGVDRVEFFR
jgi:hypothetical protein